MSSCRSKIEGYWGSWEKFKKDRSFSTGFQTSTVVRKAQSSVRKLGVSYSDSGRLKCLSLRSGVSKCERIETSLSKYMIAWASAVQKCPDELRRCPPSIRTAWKTFGTATATRLSSLEQSFSSLRTLLEILFAPVLLIEVME